MTKPSLVTEPSLLNVKVSPAASATSTGPVVPLYRTPAMVTKSKPDSVLNSVALTTSPISARMVHRSLLS